MTGDILIVTDKTPQALHPLREALSADGYVLRTARHIEAAFQQARQHPPVAVIIDANLQAEDSLHLCRWLRTDPATVAVTVLFATQDSQQRLDALEAGADEFLTAPLDRAEVRTRLRTLRVGHTRPPSLEDFLTSTPDLALGANPVDILGSADLLSHDLKSPLGVMMSSLELLRIYAEDRLSEGNLLAERELRLYEGALLACHRLTFLINDMVDLAKLEADAYPLQLEALDVLALAQEILQEKTAALTHKQIAMTFKAPDALPSATGDRNLLKRVCNALLDNMLRFTPANSQANLTLHTEKENLLLCLTDHGRPIAPGYEEAIFERGVQWEARQHGSRTSVAMGLPFARTAMRRMDGDLIAASDPADRTTTFCAQLPLADNVAGPDHAQSIEGQPE